MFIRRNETQKNIIEFGEFENKVYKFDINQNRFIGLRDTLIKTPTLIRKIDSNSITDNVLKDFIKIAQMDLKQGFDKYTLYFDIIEKIDNITNSSIDCNFYVSYYITEALVIIKNNLKQALNYIKQKNEFNIRDFRTDGDFIINLSASKLNLSPHFQNETKQILIKYNDLIKYGYDIDILFKYNMVYKSTIDEFVEKCNFMNEPLYNNKYNFIKYFDYINTQYELNKNELMESNLNKNQNQNLFFENENFTMIIPTKTQQFKEEADYQQNCVFRTYMERVAYNRTNVVFIRKKENINTPYITCEISKDFKIIQYLTRFNYRVNDIKALEFKEQLEQFLQSLKEVKEL